MYNQFFIIKFAPRNEWSTPKSWCVSRKFEVTLNYLVPVIINS